MLSTNLAGDNGGGGPIDFLWIELTNQCNLQCTHCYAESGPRSGVGDKLNRNKYRQLVMEALEVGCRRIQFIGGEPTLNRDLADLIKLAANIGYTFIEVFTNLTRLPLELLRCFREHSVHVATSVYGPTAAVHDEITGVHGSFCKTIGNLRILIREGIPVRAGVIQMPSNIGQTEETIQFLQAMGVQNVGTDRVRHFGRGAGGGQSSLAELCGNCAENTLCVGADGRVSPCIMSKIWSVGSVLETPLTQLARSEHLASLRKEIYRTVVEPLRNTGADPEEIQTICTPKTCSPYESCSPKSGPGPCAPSNCRPCFPQG